MYLSWLPRDCGFRQWSKGTCISDCNMHNVYRQLPRNGQFQHGTPSPHSPQSKDERSEQRGAVNWGNMMTSIQHWSAPISSPPIWSLSCRTPYHLWQTCIKSTLSTEGTVTRADRKQFTLMLDHFPASNQGTLCLATWQTSTGHSCFRSTCTCKTIVKLWWFLPQQSLEMDLKQQALITSHQTTKCLCNIVPSNW